MHGAVAVSDGAGTVLLEWLKMEVGLGWWSMVVRHDCFAAAKAAYGKELSIFMEDRFPLLRYGITCDGQYGVEKFVRGKLNDAIAGPT